MSKVDKYRSDFEKICVLANVLFLTRNDLKKNQILIEMKELETSLKLQYNELSWWGKLWVPKINLE